MKQFAFPISIMMLTGVCHAQDKAPSSSSILPALAAGSDYAPAHLGLMLQFPSEYGVFSVGAGLSARSTEAKASLGQPFFLAYREESPLLFGGFDMQVSLSYLQGSGVRRVVYRTGEDTQPVPGLECFTKNCSSMTGELEQSAKWKMLYLHIGLSHKLYKAETWSVAGEFGVSANLIHDVRPGDEAPEPFGDPVGIRVSASRRYAGDGDRGLYGLIKVEYAP